MPNTSKKNPTRSSSKAKKSSAKKVALPGVFTFSKTVFETLNTYQSLFLRYTAFLLVGSLLLSGFATYAYYVGLTQATDEVAGSLPFGAFRNVVETVALTVSVVSGSASTTFTEAQHIFLGILYLVAWLMALWLLRHLLSGNSVRLRDGIYNAASPLISSCLVVLAGIVQLLPLALVVSLVATIASTGAVNGLLWVLLGIAVVVLFTALTLYWLAGTAFAAVIVTLPGTYPWAALRSARQVIAGYRRPVIFRLIWLGVLVAVAMFVLVAPVVLIDSLTGYKLSALVVFAYYLAGAVVFLYASAYVYLLYRGVIDERG